MRKYLFCLLAILLLSGCSSMRLGLSLDERYEQAYQDILIKPSEANMKRYMDLSKTVAELDMKEANAKAKAATRESDKGFTEYFRAYGSIRF
ncbi:lipoprotein [Photorhabdus sp. APURE]|uniref:lipoprotein n=1 Tax=Photorhabdus aballayi TaxID=2991723 RepID=UPI00223DC5DF|nr:lipoprotein [Photorhabdus aballayi]MCW7550146.1 lipoprotein [Photorhabdus aballayi]